MEKSPAAERRNHNKNHNHNQTQEVPPTRRTTSYKAQIKLSVNVSGELGERLRNLAFEQRLSESSIVQVALQLFFARGDDALLGMLLKELGATLRRK